MKKPTLSHLQQLEHQSIHIIREVMATADKPVMLYSMGKDSSLMLHLAKKAFAPGAIPFPLLHVDTTWKFKEMIAFRDKVSSEAGINLITYQNPDGIAMDINPFIHGSTVHTDIMKTEGLKKALNKYGFDVILCGARRDEEKSRAKERIFSFRDKNHRWDPKNQRPELWNNFNSLVQKSDNMRVFPLSDWTEVDVWNYILQEGIDLPELYFAKERPTIERGGMLIVADDERMVLEVGEKIENKMVRFRTLGCYPLTSAILSHASTLAEVVEETLQATTSERQGRAIDKDTNSSMEKKKKEGYF